MASEAGNPADDLTDPVEYLTNEIGKFDFVSALRWLDCAFPENPRLGESIRITDENVRLSQSVSLAFKGVALESLQPRSGKHSLQLSVNFLGLLGTNGPLPLHYTEYADQRTRHHSDPTFKAFIDIFNHRMLSLFYQAMSAFDPAINFDRPASNRFDQFIGAFSGLNVTGGAGSDTISNNTKFYYAGWMGSKAKSPDGIKSIVGGYFNLPVDGCEFVGAWLDLPRDSRAILGGEHGNISLGVAAYVGKRVWSVGQKFRIIVGPVSWEDYLSFKPGGARARALYDLVRNYVGDEWDWDLELRVEEGRTDRMRLDGKSAIGFNSWLVSKSHQRGAQSNIINHSVVGARTH